MKIPKTALLLGVLLAAPVSAEIYTLYSDKGIPNIPPDSVIVYPAFAGTWDGDSMDVTPPEGLKSFKTRTDIVFNNTFYIGWGLHYDTPKNLSRFNSGELRFWVYSSTGNIKVEIKNSGDAVLLGTDLFALGWNWATMHDRWVSFRVGLAGANLTSVANPMLFTALSGPSVFYIDHVRYVNSTASSIFNVTVKNITDQQAAPGFTWTGLSGTTGWARSDQYVELELDNSSDLSWGVQFYTNNTSASANPKFGGSPSANPVGLVNAASPSMTLPLAWSVKAATLAPVAVAPTPAEPNNASDENSFQWIYMKDAATPDIPSQNTTAFQPGEPAVTVKSNAGIHFGHADAEFGAENAPNYIFLQANFSAGLANQTYQTNSLIIEHFSL